MPVMHNVVCWNAQVSNCCHWIKLLLLAFCLPFFAFGRVEAASVPEGFTDTQVAGGLTSPTSMTVLPDGRILVVQQNGVIKMIKADTLLSTNFYAVQNVDSFVERGCVGITTDPNFAINGFVYLYCTVTNGGSHNRILRVTAAGDVAARSSEQTILDLPNMSPDTIFHMGGALRFGADGKLYVAVGNHENDPQPPATANSQNLSNPFGKILRINVDGTVPGANPPPFNTAGAYPGIFSIGLRNPFTFDIQPVTGLMFINDVGQATTEEINKGVAGANYGWPAAEGNSNDTRFTNPVFTYLHRDGGCAISGGAFYNPQNQQFPDLYLGKYLFADFCTGSLQMIDPANPATPTEIASGIGFPVNLGIAPDGSVYYLARNDGTGAGTPVGTVGKINFTNTQVPRIAQSPQSQTILLGGPVTFTVAAAGATRFQWQRNGVDIAGATSPSFTIPNTVLADNQARFAATAINSFGSVTSTSAILTVTTNQVPTTVINTPAAESGYASGDTISYSGTGTDPEDGALPAGAFTWQVDFHHDTHSHPFLPATSGAKSGSFIVPDFEAVAVNTWLRFTLTVKDSGGQTNTVVRDIYPRTQISAMTPVGAPVNGLGPIEKDKSNGTAAAGDGRTIMLAGIPYAKGLGVSAPSDIRYNLGAACSGNFVADVGVDDEVGNLGSVVFQVFLDDVKVFDSGVVRGSDLRKTVSVSVAGKNELRLVVADGGDGNASDHADWAGARIGGCNAVTAPADPVPAPDAATPAAPVPVVPSAAPAAPESTTGAALASPAGGGGCAIGGDGRIDPTLLFLLAAALGLLGWRRRSKGA